MVLPPEPATAGPTGRRALTPAPTPALGLLLALLAGCSGPGAGATPRHSLIDSDPAGAAVFVEGGYVGSTPAQFFLPAKERVEVRLELPGYLAEQGVLLRRAGTAADAPAGVGWEQVYYYPLTRKGD